MTAQWIFFAVIEPVLIMTVAVLAVLWHERAMRRCDRKHREKELRKSMTIADRVADLQRTLDALLAGASGWPPGLIDIALKRLETSIEVLWMSDEELREMSARYQEIASKTLCTTSAALMIEVARRSGLTAHERITEAAERAREE